MHPDPSPRHHLLPITALDPSHPELPQDKCIRGVVTLLWPYSSSTRSCALLLGDPDFRLRHRRGQVRVRFTGSSAVAVATHRVGIGEHLELSLNGARWVPADEVTARRTPGKSVEGELMFGSTMQLKIRSGDNEEGKVLRVNDNEEGQRATNGRNGITTLAHDDMQTPERRIRADVGDWMGELYGAVPIYSSPAFVRRARLSAEGMMGKSFMDDLDEAEYRPRKKPRFSLQGITSWRYAARSPSPGVVDRENEEPPQGDLAQEIVVADRKEPDVPVAAIETSGAASSDVAGQTLLDRRTQSMEASQIEGQATGGIHTAQTMPPPPLPLLPMPPAPSMFQNHATTNFGSTQADHPLTPDLQPVASESLPLPSPFPNDTSHLQLETLQAIFGSYPEAAEEEQVAASVTPSNQALQSPQASHDMSAPEVGEREGIIDVDRSGSNSQELHTLKAQVDEGPRPLDELRQSARHRRTRQGSRDASVLDLTYIQDLSDTEEDDGEMYTNRFTQKVFDSQLLDPSAFQEIEDATEDDADDNGSDSKSLTPKEQSEPQLTVPLAAPVTVEAQFDQSLSIDQARDPSVEPSASVAEDVRREIARSEWLQKESKHESRTPTRRDPQLDGINGADRTPKAHTPRSDKDRIMAQTYQSLFGFSDPNAQTVPAPEEIAEDLADDSLVTGNIERTPRGLPRGADSPSDNKLAPTDQTHTPRKKDFSSHVILDLVSDEDDDRHAVETDRPLSQDSAIREPSGDSHVPDPEINENRLLEPQAPVLEATTSEPETHSDQLLTAQMDNSAFLEFTAGEFANDGFSFPSTTAVATDYLSSTEPVSFERMLHINADPPENDSLSFQTVRSQHAVGQVPDTDFEGAIAAHSSNDQSEHGLPVVQQPQNDDILASDVSAEGGASQGFVQSGADRLSEDHAFPDLHMKALEQDENSALQAHVTEQLALEEHTSTPPASDEQLVNNDRLLVSEAVQQENESEQLQPGNDDTRSTLLTDQLSAESGRIAAEPSHFLAQRTVQIAPPLSPIHSQDRTHSQASVTQVNAVDLQRRGLPPTPQLTQGDSLIQETATGVEPIVFTPSRDAATPDLVSPHEFTRAGHLSRSPPETPLRRSTRTSQRPKKHDSHVDQIITELSPLNPADKSPRRSRKSQTPAEPETIPFVVPPVKATPTRRSNRLHAKAESQDGDLADVTSDAIQVSKRATRSRASSKTLSKGAAEEILDNITTMSGSDKSSVRTDKQSLEPELPPTSIKTPSKLPHMKETSESMSQGPDVSVHTHKTPAKRSTPYKFPTVPDVISQWFSPRRSSRLHPETQAATPSKPSTTTTPGIRASGIATSLSYYTPLSQITEKLNVPGAQASPAASPTDRTLDVLAVVTDATSAPARAKSGPRDYFTVFHITDPSLAGAAAAAAAAATTTSTSAPAPPLPPSSSTSSETAPSNPLPSVAVEVFRPWHAKLPVARPGDVVLLRTYAVRSRRRQPYLLSTDASAWCVWRYEAAAPDSDAAAGGDEGERTSTAVDTELGGNGGELHVREEVKGPPVELGDEERLRARELREWWVGNLKGGE